MEQSIFSEAKSKMDKAIEHYKKELSSIRTGRASSSILNSIKVDYPEFKPVNKTIKNLQLP